MAHERLGTYRPSYSTAVRALLAYGCPAVLAIFLFRDADTLLSWAAHLTLGVGSHDLTVHAGTWSTASVALLVFQLPGVLAAGAVIVRRELPAYDGAWGYLKACVAAEIICLGIAAALGAAALAALPGLLTWLDAQTVR
jgi:hypothetical protein